MAEPELRPAGAPSTRDAEGNALSKYLKAGVYERLWESTGSSNGRSFHATSKGIASILIGRAQYKRAYHCIVTDAEFAAKLGVDDKTVRKYLQPLLDAKLVSYRLVARCRKDYDVLPLFRRFGEERLEPGAITSLADHRNQVGKDSPPGQVGSSSPPESPAPAPPGPTKDLPLLDTSAIRTDLGLQDLQGFDAEIFGIADHLGRWGASKRFMRALVKRHGLSALGYGIGYVVQQLRANKRGTIREPLALLTHALKKGYIADLPDASIERDDRQVGNLSPPGEKRADPPADLEEAIWGWIADRFPGAFVRVFRNGTTIAVEGGIMRITCQTRFNANVVRDRVDYFQRAAGALLGIDVSVVVGALD
jgi:hypothetical protein